jgi:hypothetical protein
MGRVVEHAAFDDVDGFGHVGRVQRPDLHAVQARAGGVLALRPALPL